MCSQAESLDIYADMPVLILQRLEGVNYRCKTHVRVLGDYIIDTSEHYKTGEEQQEGLRLEQVGEAKKQDLMGSCDCWPALGPIRGQSKTP